VVRAGGVALAVTSAVADMVTDSFGRYWGAVPPSGLRRTFARDGDYEKTCPWAKQR